MEIRLILGLVLLCPLIGCSPTKVQQVQQKAQREVYLNTRPRILVRSNAPKTPGEDPSISYELFDSKGSSNGNFAADVKDGIAEVHIQWAELPEGEYFIISNEEGQLRRVLKVQTSNFPTPYDFRIGYGDVNDDGKIDDVDINHIKKWLGTTEDDMKWGSAPFPMRRADINWNGKVDADDLALAKSCLGMKDDPMPVWKK